MKIIYFFLFVFLSLCLSRCICLSVSLLLSNCSSPISVYLPNTQLFSVCSNINFVTFLQTILSIWHKSPLSLSFLTFHSFWTELRQLGPTNQIEHANFEQPNWMSKSIQFQIKRWNPILIKWHGKFTIKIS